MRQAHKKLRHRPSIRTKTDDGSQRLFVDSNEETANDVARQVFAEVSRQTSGRRNYGQVPDEVNHYLAEFKSIDNLSDAARQNAVNGLDANELSYYHELVDLMTSPAHNLSRVEAEKTALKLALKHGGGSLRDC